MPSVVKRRDLHNISKIVPLDAGRPTFGNTRGSNKRGVFYFRSPNRKYRQIWVCTDTQVWSENRDKVLNSAVKREERDIADSEAPSERTISIGEMPSKGAIKAVRERGRSYAEQHLDEENSRSGGPRKTVIKAIEKLLVN